MTSKQYRDAIDKLGLTQTAAAKWLGVSRRTSQKYAAGKHRIPEATAKLLRLVLKLQLKPMEVM